MEVTVKPIINSLFYAEIHLGDLTSTSVGQTKDEAVKLALKWLLREIDHQLDSLQSIELVKVNILKVYRTSIGEIAGLAEHYYLSESPGLDDSVGWGPYGLELRGKIKLTPDQLDRMNRFILASKYDINVNNCEHFANFIVYGINLSSQQHVWWKNLGSSTIRKLQYANSVNDNICALLSKNLTNNLRKIKLEAAKIEAVDFISNNWPD